VHEQEVVIVGYTEPRRPLPCAQHSGSDASMNWTTVQFNMMS